MDEGSDVYDVLVVGAGIEGSATAYQLAKMGKRVALVEQFRGSHTRGSSHGCSRIIRYLYPESFYVKMMMDAYPMWDELQEKSGRSFFWRTGGVSLFRKEAPSLHAMRRSLAENQLKFELFDNNELNRRFPGLSYPVGWMAVYDPESGILDADVARSVYQGEFVKLGGTLLEQEKVLDIRPGHIVRLVTSRGIRAAHSLILTPGAWAKSLLSQIGLHPPLEIWRINVFYWPAGNPSLYSRQSGFPIYISDDGRPPKGHFYALPAHEYPSLVKVCWHYGKTIHSPDDRDRPEHGQGGEIDDVTIVGEHVQKYFPGLVAQPSIVETCMYMHTPDSHPIIDHHPHWRNIVIGCGFSGHGFKLAPVVGQILADLSQGLTPMHTIKPFALSRFSTRSSL